ncbi:DNA-binding transcriptional regulator, GntR family [Anaerovirgula multivorans]|uniref:DNA-binding transcriptional regulator, GntR family n=1 Tax=Anaerovirgula multivorans TaxID=312168 RepID=A0A239JL69_9FIRM|nr:GntR family transcriptional regulator [Anaerovirgula multivorans]SNT06148.1 DNA-binding transcriptional regulator, GntR family [Anaerovirgula multivorans]
MNILKRESYETARDYAYRTIRENIISLNLEPGSMLSENEIAQELGISRTPVREALIELSKTKMVEIIPQRGSFISKIDYGIIEEARFFRLIVEIAIAELACDFASNKDIEELEELVSLQEFYTERNMPDKMLAVDNEFHKILYRIANKEFIRKIVEDTTVHFDRVRRLSISAIKMDSIIDDHRAIIKAIEERDKKKVKEVVTKHLTRYKVDEELIRKKYPEYILN